MEHRVTTYVDKRIDDVNQRIHDLRDFIEANRLLKNNWRTFAVAALATAAVIGTFVLQLMEALNLNAPLGRCRCERAKKKSAWRR